MQKILLPLTAIGAAFIAAPAAAQSTPASDVYGGLQVGTHDFGLPTAADDNGVFYGGFVGVDVPVSGSVFVGAEGNFNFGSSVIDREYGVAARIGTEIAPGTKLFVRGGYQEVDFDVRRLTGVANPPAGVDDTDGDYLVGVGADVAVTNRVGLRLAADTISFDSTRISAGVVFHF